MLILLEAEACYKWLLSAVVTGHSPIPRRRSPHQDRVAVETRGLEADGGPLPLVGRTNTASTGDINKMAAIAETHERIRYRQP